MSEVLDRMKNWFLCTFAEYPRSRADPVRISLKNVIKLSD